MFKQLRSLLRRPEMSQSEALAPEPTATARVPEHIGRRRQLCFWEPIFAPDVTVRFEPYDWQMDRDAGPCRRFIHGPTLREQVTPGDTFIVKKVTFKECDFQGNFFTDTLIMFDECDFDSCDFAYSVWKHAHFRKCNFTDSSISLAIFERCEFSDCEWERLGFGSKTEFHSTFVRNPAALIGATVSRPNPKDKSWKHRANQWYRLHGTRAHVLRTLMLSHQSTGDEHTYYKTVCLHELQCAKERMSKDVFGALFTPGVRRVSSVAKLVFHFFDYLILQSLGWLNRWGLSPSVPCFALAACWVGFAQVYQRGGFSPAIEHPMQKSFDITFLVGYGNQTAPSDPGLTLVQDAHALIAIIIYTVFFATIVSKLSRAR